VLLIFKLILIIIKKQLNGAFDKFMDFILIF